MKILITGGNGFIARNISNKLKNCEIFLTNRSNLNLLDSKQVDNFFKNSFYDLVIHSAVSGGSRLQEDDDTWVYKNILMVNNLMSNSDNFSKLISFGSGAELDRRFDINENSILERCFPIDPYGLSKNSIAKSFSNNEKFYNIRIFNVFNEDELDTRMIKSNILNYIYKKPITIFQNKIMDFFHMDDLTKIIEYYLYNDCCPKTINCSYREKYSLFEISQMINNLSDYKVEIKIENNKIGNSYYGKYDLNKINIKIDGLNSGIIKMYNKLSNI